MMSYTLFMILIFIVAVLLILIIMVQNPKGGGLSSSFGGGAQSMGGVQNTTDFLDKATWTLATVLLALILLSNFAIPRTNTIDTESETKNIVNERDASLEAPATLDTSSPSDSAQ
ncbi:MAG: preprotein translocase subunit SecG [Bacteroidota bacterium]